MKQNIFLFDAPARVIKDECLVDTLQDMVMNQFQNEDKPFYVMDVGDIVQKVKTWRHKMPRVKMFYAVKCNDHPYVLQTLNALGTGFDCASKKEFKKVIDMGVDPSRIIFAHPSKPTSHLRSAKSFGVNLMTFDCKSELDKISVEFPAARLVLRIRCDAMAAQCPLGVKFGILPEYAPSLLQDAKDLGLDVVGVSFHVGSGCQEPEVFLRAIGQAKEVFDAAKEIGFNLYLLDIGGGFRGNSETPLDQVAGYVNQALEEHFPDERAVEVIAEPGRYVVESSFTLVTKVLSKKSSEAENKQTYSYYLNDGVYGSFNCILYDHQEVSPNLLRDVNIAEPYYNSTIWGPTCDSMDMIKEDALMPELYTGDFVYWRNMGAYTLVGACPFNGFPVPDVHMIVPFHTWIYLDEVIRDLEASAGEKKDLDTVDSAGIKPIWSNGYYFGNEYGPMVDHIDQIGYGPMVDHIDQIGYGPMVDIDQIGYVPMVDIDQTGYGPMVDHIRQTGYGPKVDHINLTGYGPITDHINQTVQSCKSCGQIVPGLSSFDQKEK